jgi:DNA-binding transcriptional ArsR family regulator
MSGGYCCKITSVIDERRLSAPRRYTGDLNDYLVAKWVGAGHHDAIGYRPLVTWFNKRLMRTVYRRHNRSDTDARIAAEYETLVGDDAETYQREEVMADLSADGIDGEALAADFISKSTLSRHLRNCLDAEKETESGGDWQRDQIEFARKTFKDNIDSALSSLGSTGQVRGVEDATVETPVLLACSECPTRVRLETALEQGYVCGTHSGQQPVDTSGRKQSNR